MKKIAMMLTSIALVAAVAVGGTLAYLTATTNTVTNTFTMGGLVDSDAFVLNESHATKGNDGKYTLTATRVEENSYTVLPGVNLPKDPSVQITEALSADAYVFVEVVNALGDGLSVEIDSQWVPLTGVTGRNGGQVYYYEDKVSSGTTWTIDGQTEKHILKDDKVTVSSSANVTGNATLKFYGYMAQATGFADASAAWTAAFGTSTTPQP